MRSQLVVWRGVFHVDEVARGSLGWFTEEELNAKPVAELTKLAALGNSTVNPRFRPRQSANVTCANTSRSTITAGNSRPGRWL